MTHASPVRSLALLVAVVSLAQLLACDSSAVDVADAEPCCGAAALRVDGGLASGTSVYDDKTFVPLLPYLTEGEARDSTEASDPAVEIANTVYDDLYRSETWVVQSPATFTFPVANGSYTVHLHFADWYSPGIQQPGERLFHVDIQGARAFTNVDIVAEVGKNAALVKSADAEVTGGQLTITFTNDVFSAEIGAIEILPRGDAPLATTTSVTCGPGDGLCPADCTDAQDPDCPPDADYYVSADGDDSADGTSPETAWQTLTELNARFPGLSPGDRIALRRGDTFHGTLEISRSGEIDAPIVITAYGVGPDPVISGFTSLSSWSSQGGGVHSSPLSCASTPNIVTLDGVSVPIGRAPDTGWLSIDSHSGHVSLTDAELPSPGSWTGAEVVIRKNHWIVDRCPISSHTGNTLTYSSPSDYDAQDGWGYFIQNDLETLSKLGEWYCADGQLYMYFGSESPTTHTVEVATLSSLVELSHHDDIVLEHLTFEGADQAAIRISAANRVTVQESSLRFSGYAAIDGGQAGGSASAGLQLLSNAITDAQDFGILLGSEFDGAVVRGNTLRNIGMIPGMSGSGDGHTMGIKLYGDGHLVEHNSLTDMGYNGIDFGGNDVIVRYNVVDGFAHVKDDSGAIYTSSFDSMWTGREITSNVVLNAAATTEGVGDGSGVPATNGIYLDQHNTDVLVQGNTIVGCAYGISVHNSHEIEILDNSIFDTLESILLHNTGEWPDSALRNLDIQGNVLVTRVPTYLNYGYPTRTLTLHAESEDGEADLLQYGVSDYNYHVKPITTGTDHRTLRSTVGWYGVGGVDGHRDRAEWNAWSGQEAHSHESPVSLTDEAHVHFLYNATESDKSFSLSTALVDVDNASHSGTVTLPPFASLVLFGAGAVTEL